MMTDEEKDLASSEVEDPSSFFDDEQPEMADLTGGLDEEEVPVDIQASRNRGSLGKGIGRVNPMKTKYKNTDDEGLKTNRHIRVNKKSKDSKDTENSEETDNSQALVPRRGLLGSLLNKKDEDNKQSSDESGMDTVKKAVKTVTGRGITLKVKIAIVVLLLLLVALPILLLVLLSDYDGNNRSGISNGRYYNAACSSITVVESSTNSNGTYDLEEYVAGVVSREVGGFNDDVVYQVAAIAARTYVLRNHDNCTIAGNSTRQAFAPTNNEKIIQAVADTNGAVLMKNGELISTMYDALAIIGESGNDYIISQQNQHIPKSWISSHLSAKSIEYYKNHAHGKGMSQWGAYYLSTEKGYDAEKIIKYYYGDDVEFGSIFGIGSYDNYTIATSSGAADQIHEPLRNILQSRGTSVSQFNQEMMESVIAAGPGTRYGVVAAVAAVVGKLWEQYQIRLPYTYCGAHSCNILVNGRNVNKTGGTYYGIDPDWGSYIGNFYYGAYGPYNYYGPDCSGFVSWAIFNGGFSGAGGGANSQGQLGPRHLLSSGFMAQPGDLLSSSGHIMMIIGVDPENHLYYIAHASSGASGVKIDKVDYTNRSDTRYVVDMTNFYNTHANVTGAEDYRNKFLNNMYT